MPGRRWRRMAKLKVFTTQSGFYDLAVATTSRPKALAAWGIHQDLFAHGQAREATEKAIVEAALAKPGVVLRRPLGTKGEFSEEPALPKVKGRAKTATKANAKAKARKAAAEAKAELKKANEAHKAELAALKRERATLDAKLAGEEKAWREQRKRLGARKAL
jgi:colicin import membrane protein